LLAFGGLLWANLLLFPFFYLLCVINISVLQFAMTPGPTESVNLVPTYYHFGRVGSTRTKLAARVYRVIKDIPKGTQV